MAARAALMAEEGEGEGWAAFRQRTKEMREATGAIGVTGGAAGAPGRADPAAWLRLAALQEDSICLLLRQQIENEKANAAAAAAGSRAAAEADETTGSGLGAAGAGAGIAVWGGDKSSGGGKRARRRRQGAASAHDAKATVLITNATRAVRLSVRQKQLAIYREGLASCPRQQRQEQRHTHAHTHTSTSSPSSGSQGTRGGRRELHRGLLRVLRCMLESGDATEQEVQAAWDDALNECASGAVSGMPQRVDEGRVPPGGPPAFASDEDEDGFDPSLWCEYLSCRQSMFASFSVPAMRQEFARAIESLRRARHLRYRRQGQESRYAADCGMLDVFCLAAEFERSSGYVIDNCRRIVSVCMRVDKRSGVPFPTR